MRERLRKSLTGLLSFLMVVTCVGASSKMTVKAGLPPVDISVTVTEGSDLLDTFGTYIWIDNVPVADGKASVHEAENHELKFQVAFGSSIEKVNVNEVDYEITPLEDGQIQVVVPHATAYTVKLTAGQSDDVTIMWTYDPADAEQDYYVDHGKVEVVSIKRAGATIFDKTTESEDVRIDDNGGWVAIKRGDDVVLRLIPDYGYQLESVTINDQTLVPQEGVSEFSLPDIQGNLHFKGVFVNTSDKIADSSDAVSNVSISNGSNAAATGNLQLKVEDNSAYSADVTGAGAGATAVASIDLTLDNIVSKGNGQSGADGWWTTNITEFTNPIKVGLKVDATKLDEGQNFSVIRDHNGKLTTLDATYDAETETLTFETNQFSTFTIAKVSTISNDPFSESFIPEMIEEKIEYPNTTEDPKSFDCKFYHKDGKSFWYENGVRQGTYDDPKGVIGDGTIRGREIYDADTNAWYWCDSILEGAKAVNKEVWMPYIYQGEKAWSDAEIKSNAETSGSMASQVEAGIKKGNGKWVRYNANGKMYKGWYKVTSSEAQYYPKQVGNIYYYDEKTGLMAHGDTVIDGVTYHFDETTGVLQR